MSRPTTEDLTGDHSIALLARKHWLVQAPSKSPSAVPELWEAVEADTPFGLLLLEQLQAFERYLWPTYNEDASNQHVLLLALLASTKRQEQLPVWPLFTDRRDDFSTFFRRILHLTIDQSLSTKLRTHLLVFLVGVFQSLDSGLVRKECASLLSIGIWHNLHSEAAREQRLAKGLQLQKAWRAQGKRYENADAQGQARLRFERSWLYTLVLDFLGRLYDSESSVDVKQQNLAYCERFLELLCDLLSQLPTRRYVNALLQDVNLLAAIKLSPLYQDGDDSALLRDMYQLVEHYGHFPIDDQTGKQLSTHEHDEAHNAGIARLQNVALKAHPEKLKILYLANYGSLSQRDELLGHVKALSDGELAELCSLLGLRTQYPEKSQVVTDRPLFEEVLATTITGQPHYTIDLRRHPILPTESSLYSPALLRAAAYDSTHPLTLPKLNLQYLSLGDFLYRSFILHRAEAFYALRADLEDTLKRLQPRMGGGRVQWDGFSRMAIPIPKPAVTNVDPPRVGEEVPGEVRVEVSLDVSRLQPGLRKEWEGLIDGEVVYLLAVRPVETKKRIGNGAVGDAWTAEGRAIQALRCAEVISVLDENGRMLRRDNHEIGENGVGRGRQRRLLLRLDASAYAADKAHADAGKGDILDSINLIIRRRARENNFKAVLSSLRSLALAPELPSVPVWLQDVFLGFGDPSGASYKRLESRLKKVDYRDTFLDWQHLIESLPGKTVEPDPSAEGSFGPPYVLTSMPSVAGEAVVGAEKRPNKKRRRDEPDGATAAPAPETLRVTTYTPENRGPYFEDAPRGNRVRFTPEQVEAVTSGTQPGLTVIVGPPGTGKTDVVVQVASNIYHGVPKERTLVLAHSNHALDAIFKKIGGRDIDQRHLLRLGGGEDDGGHNGEAEGSRVGRVERFMERGAQLLGEVQRLAESIGAVGAHGGSCETASYFSQVHVQPAWSRFWASVAVLLDVETQFPFHAFFANAPQPLFPPGASHEQHIEIAKGCERHIDRIFEELAEIRPFELLRANKDKQNYLLAKQARIIAMTTTYAAMRRQEIAGLGFRYENVIMEEAAQVTEAESFIPLVLQSAGALKRVVLVGDHLQNAPIVQSSALREGANVQQSLFQRLVRLGVPHTVLSAQGRARPGLAALVEWRYPSLTDLPRVVNEQEFVQANAGFRYEYQFIDVPDYKGQGESTPTPHFMQNLGEAEYAVAVFMYMRLLGYPAERITILCAYAGQRALVRDVLARRCKGKRLFGMPGWVGTVDKYQGEENDYVILSLVRTRAPGYLGDLRRLTVALSRARLGLYVLGRREVFESSLQLREAFEAMFERNNKLALVTGEMFPTQRSVIDEAEAVEMEGVEHLGKYVYEMTQAKMKALKDGGGVLPPLATTGHIEDEEAEEDDIENETMEDVDDEAADAIA